MQILFGIELQKKKECKQNKTEGEATNKNNIWWQYDWPKIISRNGLFLYYDIKVSSGNIGIIDEDKCASSIKV